ncbi:hypothetical protein Vafri_3443 [Volvox africanus]|uniref:Uncharacterized protein n=1 Tax=Volvox africanus TaxID=51714 RepID=A0A8J4AS91_9CHLO|nr:hypothetical protein Vafri_3443 [Volvox africanus]
MKSCCTLMASPQFTPVFLSACESPNLEIAFLLMPIQPASVGISPGHLRLVTVSLIASLPVDPPGPPSRLMYPLSDVGGDPGLRLFGTSRVGGFGGSHGAGSWHMADLGPTEVSVQVADSAEDRRGSNGFGTTGRQGMSAS